MAPAFTQLPVDTTVTDGTTAVLRCEVSGAPRPAIVWSRGRWLAPASGGEPAGQGYLCYSRSPTRSVTRKILGSQTGETPRAPRSSPSEEEAHAPTTRGQLFPLQTLRQCLGPGGPLNQGARFQPLCEGGRSRLGVRPLLL